jgi:hypothetical protein
MSNKRINKAYVRYDGSGRVIPGSLILNRFKPKVGNLSETPAYLCCNPAPVVYTCIEFVVDTTDGAVFTLSFNSLVQGSIKFTIDWGDGTSYPDSGTGGYYEETHTYPEVGQQYTATICFDNPGNVLGLNFYGND